MYVSSLNSREFPINQRPMTIPDLSSSVTILQGYPTILVLYKEATTTMTTSLARKYTFSEII